MFVCILTIIVIIMCFVCLFPWYSFQASTSMERSEWIEKLQEAILNALNLAPEKKEGKKGVRAAVSWGEGEGGQSRLGTP